MVKAMRMCHDLGEPQYVNIRELWCKPMVKVMRMCLPGIFLIGFLFVSGCGGGQGSFNNAEPLFLNAASQNGQVFLTWNSASSLAKTRVQWRKQGETAWQQIEGNFEGRLAVSGLQNEDEYEFVLSDEADIRRDRIIAVPQIHALQSYPHFNHFLPALSLFTSQEAMNAWMQTQEIDPLTLTLRGKPVLAWNEHAANGYYSASNGEKLLLLRNAATRFRAPSFTRSPEQVRAVLRKTLWRNRDPFGSASTSANTLEPLTLVVPTDIRAVSAQSYRIRYHSQLASRITFLMPSSPIAGRFAIYHEGHGSRALDVAKETINWLLDRGWQVVTMDMPLSGANTDDMQAGLMNHYDFDSLDNGIDDPVALFLLPVKAVVDHIVSRQTGQGLQTVMMIGRSGGGWTTYVYAALDARIAIAVSIAGGTPMSQRLANSPYDLGDYEQFASHLYDVVPHEDMMTSAGTRAAFYVFNENDPCCFRVRQNEPLVSYLQAASVQLNKPLGVFIDTANPEHSISASGLIALETFLEPLLKN